MALRTLVLLGLAGGLFAQKSAQDASPAASPQKEAPPAPVEWTCPMDPEVRAKAPGQCSRCGMKLEPGIKEFVEYPVTLTVSPVAAPAGKPLRLEFRIFDPKSGKPVTAFETVHEKLFHLFLFSADLQHFEHVHPVRAADGASFALEATLPKPGVYRLLADFYPTGGTPQMTPLTLATAGYDRPVTPAKLAANLTPQHGENLEVELQMDPPEPIAGKKTLLFFHLKPADGLERYIGAWGHLLAVSDDLQDAIHTHPEIADGGPQAQFNIFFPREAAYRIWVQFQRKGVVNTLAFTVPVSRLK